MDYLDADKTQREKALLERQRMMRAVQQNSRCTATSLPSHKSFK